jgi:hypothetical protein
MFFDDCTNNFCGSTYLTLTEDAEIFVKGAAEKIVFKKDQTVFLYQSMNIKGTVDADFEIKIDEKSTLHIAAKSFRYDNSVSNPVSVYASGQLHYATLATTGFVPVAGEQYAEINHDVRFHRNGNLSGGRVYNNLTFEVGSDIYTFPGKSYMGGIMVLNEDGSPNLTDPDGLGKLFIKKEDGEAKPKRWCEGDRTEAYMFESYARTVNAAATVSIVNQYECRLMNITCNALKRCERNL